MFARLFPSRKVPAGLLYIFFLFLFDAQISSPASFSKGDHLVGLWSDACPCRIPCPCWKSGKASAAFCLNIQLYDINQAILKGVDKGNLQFVLIAMPMGSLGISTPRWAYVDSTMQQDKVQAVIELVQMLYGVPVKVIPDKVVIRALPGLHEVNIPRVLTYKVRRREADEAKVDQSVASYLYPWLREPEQGLTELALYTPEGEEIRYEGTNSLFARVEWPRTSRPAKKP